MWASAAGRIGRELVLGRATVDELVAATGWPVASVLAALTLLERRGLAAGVHGRFRPAGDLILRRSGRRRPTPADAFLTVDGPLRFASAERPVLPSRRPTSPRAARAPPSLRPQEHEQECLLHKAAVALLAAPIIVAVYIGALMRRSTLARVSLAVGLSLVLGMGVLDRPSGRPPRSPPRRPRSCR